MAFMQVEEALPQLNPRTSLGRVILPASTGSELETELGHPRQTAKVIICCGTAFLSMEALRLHQQEGLCKQNGGVEMSPPLSQEQDPLDVYSFSDENEDEGVFVPIINHVESLQTADIDEIDIFEEEPRALIDNNRLSSIPTSSEGFRNRHHYHDNRDPIRPDTDDDEEDYPEEAWQNLEDDYEDDDEEDNNVALTEWDEDELEEVEIYGDASVYEKANDVVDTKAVIHLNNLNPETTPSARVDSGREVGTKEHEGKYKCHFPGCIYTAPQERNLRMHEQKAHDPTGTHVCSACVCRYQTKSELNRHLKMFHGQYTRTPTTPDIRKVLVNGKKLNRCEACGYTTRSVHPMKIHVHSAHDPSGRFRCPHCVCQYSKGNQLTQHLAKCHTKAKTSKTRKQKAHYNVVFSAKTATGPNSYRQVATFKTEVGVLSFDKLVANNVMLYKCKHEGCTYKSPKRFSIMSHTKGAHAADGKFACPHCPCRYRSATHYQSHIIRAHPKNKPRSDFAGKMSKSSSSQSPSRKTAKFSPKPSTSLTSNEIIPTLPAVLNAPPESYKLVFRNNKMCFKCEACGFQARDLGFTSAHIYSSHGPSANHFCKYCTFKFSHRGALGLHLARLHPEYIQAVEHSDEPRMEILSADGIKIFRCKLCAYVISTESKCRQHVVMSHNPDGQFTCDHCPCRFTQMGPLSHHKASFHSDMDDADAPTNPSPGAVGRPPMLQQIDLHQTASTTTMNTSTDQFAFAQYSTIFVNNKRMFSCDSCGKKTPKEAEIKKHVVAAHNPANKYKCLQCTCQYAFTVSLSKHISTKHNPGTGESTLLTKSATEHNEGDSQSVPWIQCDKCTYSSPDKSLMVSHKRLHLLSNKFPCSLCSFRFATNNLLLKHLASDHANEQVSASNSPQMPIIHQEPIVFNYPGYDKHMQENGPTTFHCTRPGCDYISKGSTAMLHHVNSAHDPDRDWSCEHCSCRFGTEKRLDQHMKNYHGIDEPKSNPTTSTPRNHDEEENEDMETNGESGLAVLKCQIPGCLFETEPQHESVLANHMKTAHSPKAKFKCDQCPCRFHSMVTLEEHSNSIHSNLPQNDTDKNDDSSEVENDEQENEQENSATTSSPGKPFQCKFCDFLAANKTGFITHLTANHSAKNPHQCAQCPCRFATFGGLTSHEYRCHKKKPSSFKNNTRIQQSSGSTVGPNKGPNSASTSTTKLSCTLCSAVFNNPSSLSWHTARAHKDQNSEKSNFSCDLCKDTYETENELVLHKNKVHDMNSKECAGDDETGSEEADSSEETHNSNSVNVTEGKCTRLSTSAITKAVRKYAEIEDPDNLSDTGDGDLFKKHIVKKRLSKTAESLPQPPNSPETDKKKFKCLKCPYSAADVSSLNNHEERAHFPNGFCCSYCSCSFQLEGSLKKHKAMKHTGKYAIKAANPAPLRVSRSSVGLRDGKNESAVETETEESAPPLPTLQARPPPIQTKIPKLTLHKCYLCSYTCRLPLNLSAHKLAAHVPNGYVCKYCPCSYRTTAALNSHLVLRHKKYISVGQPGAAGLNYSSTPIKLERESSEMETQQQSPDMEKKDMPLKNNQQAESSGLFKCFKCPFFTKLKLKLTAHIKSVHEKNQCKTCEESFSTKALLDNHMLTAHEAPDALKSSSQDALLSSEEFSCKECPYTTSLRIKLKRHEEKHKNSEDINTSLESVSQEVDEATTAANMELRRGTRKRKPNPAVATESQTESDNESAEPKKKPRKVVAIVPQIATRTSTRRSAQAAIKIIDSVIRSEQIADQEFEDVIHTARDIVAPPKKKAKIDSDSTEIEEIDTNKPEEGSDTVSTKERTQAREQKEENVRLSLKEVATLQRPTDRVARNTNKKSQESKRTAGLREFMKFTCSRCATSFDTVRQLTQHFQVCDENKKEFNCRLCGITRVSLLKLKEHIWKDHMLEEDKLKSEMQSKVSKSSKESLYVCSLCKLGLNERKAYILHMSVPHLFRCKRCSFVSGTKTAMDNHKKTEHKKVLPNINKEFPKTEQGATATIKSDTRATPAPAVDEDDILIVYESTLPSSGVRRKSLDNGQSSLQKAKAMPNSTSKGDLEQLNKNENGVLKKENNDENSNGQIMEAEVGESMVCDECGHFSETVEEAKEHNKAVMDIESLMCFVCGYMASSPCDSIIHDKTHKENGNDEENTEDEEPMDSNGDHLNDSDLVVPEYAIEIEFKDSPVPIEGMDTVEVPMVSNDPAEAEADQNQMIIFDLKDFPTR